MFGHDDNGQMTQDAAAPQGTAADAMGTGELTPPEPVAPGSAAPAASPFASNDAQATEDAAAEAIASMPTASAPAPVAPATPMGDDAGDDLLQIKQQALQQLSPLVGHLDQTPEEKFRTTMMMIQASDNQGLIKDAYAAAQAIEDEKTRAQALLDIINEINYFTQHQAQ